MNLTPALRRKVCDTIRMLAADAVEKANSGHPGAPMAQADMALVLFDEFLRFDPTDPAWPARDRFVLSCGHASTLQYALLHLWGYDVTIDDLRDFRQWGSKTPGHPEVGETPGIEVTTGPLGQGIANSVGMALAARMLAARVVGDGACIMPQRVFALCSDGDLMEGLSAEAASLAGHWQLGNLVWLYDDNRITIEGDTGLAFTEDVAARFDAQGWQTLRADGHDHASLRTALKAAIAETSRPSIVICRTHIGYGSPNRVDTSGVHGSPLGAEEMAATKSQLGWPAEPTFLVPDDVRAFFAAARAQKIEARRRWQADFDTWREAQPEAAAVFDAYWSGATPDDLWRDLVDAAPASGATRKTSYAVIQAAAARVPALVGGSADLGGSNGTDMKGARSVGAGRADDGTGDRFGFDGRQLHFGIREHAMAAVTNGMVLHGGLRPYCGTFLVFSDYMRPSVRLAALSHIPNIFIFSHDSVFLGEDGPTHQAVEHHWALRLIPGLTYFRPTDGVEVAMAWAYALQHASGPVAIGLTRQGVNAVGRAADFDPRDVWRGGYIVEDAADPEIIIVGTGSELPLCTGAAARLRDEGRRVRVVSMVAWDLFEQQDAAWRDAVVPPDHPRVVTVEAGVTGPWRALTGRRGLTIGIDRFGASAPCSVLAEKFGLTVDAVTERIRQWF